MRSVNKSKKRAAAKSMLVTAASFALEQMEDRVMLSTSVADWSFDSLTIGTNLSPAPATGTGTALTVGLQTSSSNANSPGGVYAYPNTAASGTGDTSDILNGTGNNPSGNLADHSSTGDGTANSNPAWRLRGASDGWSDSAALASQGAQFMVSTVGDSGISLSFDLDPSSTSAPSEIAIEYTLDGTTWNIANNLTGGTDSANGGTDGVTVASNSSVATLVNGSYFQIANNSDALFWQNGLTANFSSISGANNNPNFGVRIVNAATGVSEVEVGGTSFPAAGAGNWRLDNVQISAAGSNLASPTITTNPVNQSVAAGQQVTFTAAASGTPTPTVQWFEGAVGSGSPISGATSATLSFTTSSTASDNNNTYYAVFSNSQGSAPTSAARLSDPLSAVSITTQPVAVNITSGNTATFTASATGSPLPTVQWFSATSASGPFSPISGATSTTLSFTTSTAQTGTYYEAVFTNSQSPTGVATSAVPLTVTGVSIADWNFTTVVGAPDNTPAPTQAATTAAALSLGMTNSAYAYAGTTATNSVTSDDITNGVAPEDFWRVRGAYVATGTAPNIGSPTNSKNVNGWNLRSAPSGSQGVEFDVSTVGYQSIQASFDWESTAQGIKDLQEEYNTNTSNPSGWTSIGSVLVAPSGGGVTLGNAINLSSITGANNDANFGIRFVSVFDPNGAADGLTQVSDNNGTHYPYAGASGGVYNNSSGNWGFDNIQVSGTQTPVAPSIVTNPLSQSVSVGTNAVFTAAASGFPTPTVQWQVSTNGGANFTPDTTDAGNTTNTLTVPASLAESGYEYEAIYSNSQGNTPTTAATLTVTAKPFITLQPASQLISAGSSVTLIAAASGTPAPTVQWQISTNGGANFTNISGATSTSYTFPATEALSGNEYQAIFTNSAGSNTTTAATLTVAGTPITQWNFTGGQAPSPGGNTSPGTGNSPIPTTAINATGNSATILGMTNDYDGLQSFPEADILPIRSTVDSSINEYLWRVRRRGGGGGGPTGTPGTPDGWSQNAPQGTQGVQFNVNTTGYSNVTLNFDWTQGAIGDMQAQYFDTSTSNWVNIGVPVQATGGDYYGVTPTTKTTALFSLTANTSTTINVASSTGFYTDQTITVGGVDATVTGITAGSLTILPTASGTAASGSTVQAVTNPTGVSINLQGVTAADNNPNFQLRLVSVFDPGLPQITDGNNLDPTVHGQYASGFGAANDIQVLEVNDTNNFTLTLGAQTTGTIVYSSDPTTMAANIQAALDALSTVGASNVSVASTVATGSDVPPGPITAYQGYSITFNGALKATPEPTMTANGTTNGITTWQTGSAATTVSTTITAPYSVTANQALTLSVASSTGFTAGYPILLGNITCLIDSVGSGTITVTPETSGSVISGTTVGQLGVTGFVDGSGSWQLGNISFNGDVTTGAPGISANPQPITVAGGFAATFTATAYSESLPTVQWQVSTNSGGSWANVSGGTVTPTTFTLNASNSYTSTYSFTTDANLDQSGFEYRAVFTNGSGPSNSEGATLTVVAQAAPFVLTQPINTSVQEGNVAVFTAAAAGTPTPTVQWQISTNNGSSWSNLTDSSSAPITVSGSQTDMLEFTAANNISQSGDQFRAVFTNDVTSTPSNAVTLTVLPTETVLTDWDFNSLYPSVTPTSSADPYVNGPSPVVAGIDGSVDVGGTASAIGFTLPFNPNDPATGTGAPGSLNADDVVNSPGALNSTFNENTWRIRGGINATTGGTPANGWSNFAAPGTQGAQFSVPTTGYAGVYVTLDWYSTTSGELDAQPQYTVDGTNWINLGPQVQAVSNDFYGATATGNPVPLMFDVSNINGASNNPNFGIRLVNAYNLVLSNEQTLTLNDSSNFTLGFNGKTTASIPFSPTPTTMAASIQSAVVALSNVGSNNVTVVYDSTTGAYTVSFIGALGTAIQPVMTINTTTGRDTVTQQDQYANAALTSTGPAPYNGSKGNWRFDNIVFHGDPTWLAPTSVASWNQSTQTLTVSGPTTIISDPMTSLIANNNPTVASPETFVASNDEPIINADGATAAVEIAPTDGSLNVHIGGLSLQDGATADVASVGASWSFMNKETLIIGPANNTNVPEFSIDTGDGSSLNIENNQVNINYGGGVSPEATVYADIASAYNHGSWNGSGITSSDANAKHVIGTTDSGKTVEIAYTILGDSNLDGSVNFTDLLTLAQNYNKTGTNWSHGDFNYDGSVNFTDLLDLAQNYNGTANGPMASQTANFSVDWTKAQAEALTPAAPPTPPVATHLAIISVPSTVVAGKKTKASIEVAVEDASGKIVTTDDSAITVAIATGPKGSHITGLATVNAVNGIATFSNLKLSKAGKYLLKATDGTLAAAEAQLLAQNA